MTELSGKDEALGNSALDVAMARVGDRWTLLIIDALIEGPRRFKDLEAAVPGLAPNVLTARLRRLEGDGLVVAVPYSERPARYEYRVSAEGRELAGAMRLLASWGARAMGDEPKALGTGRAVLPYRCAGTALPVRGPQTRPTTMWPGYRHDLAIKALGDN